MGTSVFPQAAAHREAVGAGEHQIQQNQVKPAAQTPFQPAVPVRGGLHLIAVQLQVVPLNGGDVGVVLHNQDFLHPVLPPSMGDFHSRPRAAAGAPLHRIIAHFPAPLLNGG